MKIIFNSKKYTLLSIINFTFCILTTLVVAFLKEEMGTGILCSIFFLAICIFNYYEDKKLKHKIENEISEYKVELEEKLIFYFNFLIVLILYGGIITSLFYGNFPIYHVIIIILALFLIFYIITGFLKL